MKESPASVDITNCANEPIHIPGKIQPHGALFAVGKNQLELRFVSENIETWLPGLPEISQKLGGTSDLDLVSNALRSDQPLSKNPVRLPEAGVDAIVHSQGDLWVVELEKTDFASTGSTISELQRVNEAVSLLGRAATLLEACEETARQMKVITGYDRIMIYEFDEEWNGKVIAEARDSHLEPFLGLHYPASDIPAQARAMYQSNWLRIIPDVDYSPVALRPERDAIRDTPLNLSGAVLRSVSPMHVQYLKNMGVGASMSVSIIVDGKLWGLIACHNSMAKQLSYSKRQACELMGKYLSSQLAFRARRHDEERRSKSKAANSSLLAQMRKEARFLDGLVRGATNLFNVVSADGAVVAYRGTLRRLGQTPSEQDLLNLLGWLGKKVKSGEFYSTESLPKEWPDAESFKDTGCGILCISIPEPEPAYVIWFKPEVIQTVNWGGNPNKPVEITQGGSVLTPRRSFSLWQETVKLRSLPWTLDDQESAEDLRGSIVEADLFHQVGLEREARSEVERSNRELDQFAHVVSHDLRDPLRGIRAFADFVLKDTGNQLISQSRTDLEAISEAASKLTSLITALHEYSKVGKSQITREKVELQKVLQDVLARLKPYLDTSSAEVRIPRALPVAPCDGARVGEIFANLISNGVKYNRSAKKQIEIGFDDSVLPRRFYVKDNGIGIKDEDRKHVFEIFRRLNSVKDFEEGTGAGLSIVKRIIDRHEGRIWIESKPGAGTTFWFTLENDERTSAN